MFLGVGMVGAEASVLYLNGEFRVRGGDLAGARVLVIPEDGASWVIDRSLDQFKVELKLQKKYLLSFEQEGAMSKQLLFDTSVPDMEIRMEGYVFPFQVTLERKGTDTAIEYAGPVGSIQYDRAIHDFGYSTDYRIAKNAHFEQRLADARVELDPKPVAARVAPLQRKPAEQPTRGRGPHETVAPTVSRVAPLVHVLNSPATAMDAPRMEVREMKLKKPAPTDNTGLRAPARAEASIRSDVNASRLNVTTDTRVEENGKVVVYRRVAHYYGGVTYFRDGRPCTRAVYRLGLGL